MVIVYPKCLSLLIHKHKTYDLSSQLANNSVKLNITGDSQIIFKLVYNLSAQEELKYLVS